MGTPAQGFRKYIQIGREATWGTAVPATRKLGLVSESFSPAVDVVEDPTLDGEVTVGAAYLVRQMARGTLELVLDYEGLLMVFDWCFGTDTFGSLGGVTVGSGPYVHSYNPRNLMNSMTVEIFKNIPSTKCHRLVGAKVVGWKITGAAGAGDSALVRLSLDVVAKSFQVNQTPTPALTIATRIPVLYHHATTVDDGTGDPAADVRMKSFEFSVASALHEDRDYLSSQNPDEFLRSDKVRTMFTCTNELQTVTMASNITTGASGSPQLIFTSGARIINLSIASAILENYNETQNGYGIETQTAVWKALRTIASPNYDLRLTVTNTETAIT